MWMRSLDELIENSQDKREVQRAIAVKMLLCGYKHEQIMSVLGVSSGFTTIGFLEYLQSLRPQAKILIIWDGASYHCSGQIKKYCKDSGQTKISAIVY